jgi:hypothetical protein
VIDTLEELPSVLAARFDVAAVLRANDGH